MLVESDSHPPLTLEITVISAQGLRNPSTQSAFSFFFSKRPIKPFATLAPTTSSSALKPPRDDTVHRTKTDSRGGENPTWNETFRVSVPDSSFSHGVISSPAVLLQVNEEKRLVAGRTLLGWCYVLMADIVQPPTGPVRFLSYRLRATDGSRSHGIVNLAVRLQGLLDPELKQTRYPNIGDSRPCPAIGIPIQTDAPLVFRNHLNY